MFGRFVVVLLLAFDLAVFQDCSSYSLYSDYSDDDSLKGSSRLNTSTGPWSSCDMGLDNGTWYRFTGALQQVKVTADGCVAPYHCNTKHTWTLTEAGRQNVSEREYKLRVRLYLGMCLALDMIQLYANIYECDTFLLYNFPQIDENISGIPADCNGTQWEPHGICLEDTVVALKLTTEQTATTFQLHPSSPLVLTANATRSPASPLISWRGGNETIATHREGFSGSIFNMWSEIMVPYDAAYRTVEYCVDSNCSVFNLFSAGTDGVYQDKKVLFLKIVLKSGIEATDITWEVNKKSYSKSEEGIIVNNGPLRGGVQIASFTMFWIDFVPGVSKVILSFDNGTEIEIPPPTKLADCQSDTYFSKGVCKNCPVNSTSPIGSVSGSACLCNANTYLNAGMCESCPKGHHSAQGSTDVSMCLQDICEINTYFLNGVCESCPDYTVGPEGSTTISDCRPCARNTYFNNDQCTDCPKGHHSDQGSNKQIDCLPNICPVNTFYETGLCKPCPSGSHSRKGSTNFHDCKKKVFPLEMVLIVIGTCLALLVMLIVAVLVYKKRHEDNKTG